MPSLARPFSDWKPLGLALTASASLLLPGLSFAAASCAEIHASNPAAGDSSYTLGIGNRQVNVFCHDMAGTPREYLVLPHTGATTNYSYYGKGPNTSADGLTTWFTKVRFNPATLTLKTDDFTFATSQGWIFFGNLPRIYNNSLAHAADCAGLGFPSGRSNVDLTGTPFDIVPDQFHLAGAGPTGSVTFTGSQIVNLMGGGYCGSLSPANNELKLAWHSAAECSSGAPSIVLNGPAELTLECGSSPYSDPGAQAFDGCGNPITLHSYNTGADSYGPGPNTSAEGTYSVSYAAWTEQGTANAVRTVNVDDRTAPTLTLKGGSQIVHTCGSQWVDPGVTATDACYGDLTLQVSRTGDVNGWAAGTYTVTYSVTDTGGNAATPVTRTVNVVNCPW
ncbi:immunoglobulin-like domain-containing protein [Hyalangium versicolor]|uniref:immunoglobulin-like domain-containing protein n=1 Tax=Hyalangium versicolor TaxID=2861190 RepID=UPI001CCB1443|nr:immunoglobulin-like domain-containing protein [Hyalangium versicolor]